MQAVRARCILRAITGNLDISRRRTARGFWRRRFKTVSNVELEMNDAISPEQKKKQLGAGQYPLFGFPGYDMISKQAAKPVLISGHHSRR